MGRKVLISFLGTGNYVPVYYTWTDERNVEPRKCTPNHKNKFVQEAIAAKLCKNWTANDCIMVFRTTQSNEKNWIDRTIINDKGDHEEIQGLKSALEGISFANGGKLKCLINPKTDNANESDDYIIPTGLDQPKTELEEIFNQVFSKLNEDDEIYFDVTHAFRTIPLFATVLFNYSKFLKGTALKAIYYGAYEKLNSETHEAPIANLIDIVHLQAINNAAASFRDFGNMGAFSNILLGDSDVDEDIQDISDALKNLDNYMQICQIEAIKEGKYITTIDSCIDNFCESNFTNESQRALLRSISLQLHDTFNFVGASSYRNIEAAIDWTIKFNMIQQGLTMAQEYITTIAYDKMENLGLKASIESTLGQNLSRRRKTYLLRKKLWDALRSDYIIEEFPEVYSLALGCRDLFNPTMRKLFKELSELRNSINHGNTTDDNTRTLEDYKNEFKTIWESCKATTRKFEYEV